MAGRYLITGVQLGMIKGLLNHDHVEIENLIDEILNGQYVGHSQRSIETDCEFVKRVITFGP